MTPPVLRVCMSLSSPKRRFWTRCKDSGGHETLEKMGGPQHFVCLPVGLERKVCAKSKTFVLAAAIPLISCTTSEWRAVFLEVETPKPCSECFLQCWFLPEPGRPRNRFEMFALLPFLIDVSGGRSYTLTATELGEAKPSGDDFASQMSAM